MLKPATYDEAGAECSALGEQLVSPKNVKDAANLFANVSLSSARLNAVANETCFKDFATEKIDLQELFGEEYSVQVPPAKTSNFALAFKLAGEESAMVKIFEDGEEGLSTICSFGELENF